ncbi:MAG TPA: OadG family protein [Oscillospiraceae bacterium]|nr:OadG family protein [Oscillospiraceae bacterium]HPF56510.1 OadG family protein [Clostridiales bacterium]HPK34532.1 OadG family protein [Oscillospiraceae bacterium]HPR74760.1 OadG family protein [Oscillospiraceae bacterium]
MNFWFLAFNWSEMSKGELSLLTTLTGLIIVFAILIILTLVISLFGKIGAASAAKPGKKTDKAADSNPKPPVKTAPPVSKSVQTTEDDSLIAVIAAAVHAFGESVGQKLAIKSVQRVPRKSKDGRSAWANAGVRDNTRSF